MKSSSYSGAARPRKRTGADHFGLFTLFLLLAASLALYIRLMATGMLSNLYLIILMVVLIVLNAVSVIVQLPLRRNKAGKLIMGIVSLLLSGAMLYGVVYRGERALLCACGGRDSTSYTQRIGERTIRLERKNGMMRAFLDGKAIYTGACGQCVEISMQGEVLSVKPIP